jgi:CheY-like chemotaxis protein
MKHVILLVDHDLSILVPTAFLLRERGYGVITARHDDEALEVLQNGDVVDTLITDVQLPVLDGFDLARRAKVLRPAIIILYCTDHPEMCKELGPALGPVLSKPYSPERVHQEIERLRA